MMDVVGQCHCRTRCVRCALRAQSNGGVLPYFLLFRSTLMHEGMIIYQVVKIILQRRGIAYEAKRFSIPVLGTYCTLLVPYYLYIPHIINL